MSVINTNITSMIGQSNLSKSQNALQTSMERLSSGLRINSAKDDAAGQAIANRMTAQITGLAQAQRNANDGISLAQTAEGSLAQINDNVQRIRELTVQALNDTNSGDDLQSIQNEIGERLAEITRISEQTDFNGVAVLGGENGENVNVNIQVGAKDGQTITIAYDAINLDSLNLEGFSVAGSPEATASDVLAVAQANVANGDTIVVDGTTYTYHVDAGTNDYTGWSTSASTADTDAEDAAASFSDIEDDIAGGAFTYTPNGTANAFAVAADGAVTQDGETVYLEEGDLTTTPTSQATGSPLETLDNALKDIDDLRSELGAIQNRFEDAITNLQTNETNLSAARSRIEDADYAVEVANMTRAQILQQAGTSVLAQANQIPQNVLSLLG